MPTYEEAAKLIIKGAIRSAIFIDENAKEPYSEDNPSETDRSISLYQQMKNNGVSLSICKYSNACYNEQKEYLFANRDLVLLDWKLEGEEQGCEKSLELLDEIVNEQKHIHFCVIYTSENKDSVLKNLLSYFSNTTKEEYDEIRMNLADQEEEIKEILDVLDELSVKRYEVECEYMYKNIRRTKRDLLTSILQNVVSDSPLCSLIKCGMAFDEKSIKSDKHEPCPSSIDASLYALSIKNIIIVILNKNEVTPNNLFQKFADTLVSYRWGVMQLVGLEMHNIQKKSSSFIDEQILKVTKKALGYHKYKSNIRFDDYLRTVMLEQLSLNLREEKLTLVDAIDSEEYDDKLQEEYISMNVFYNSVCIKRNRPLTFGDVFRCDNSYYICITALCDCAKPEKRDNCFYFAKGTSITSTKALKIGDKGFISYLNSKECVKWNLHIDNVDEPVYIVPETFIILDNMIKEQELEANKPILENGELTFKKYCLKYITTIKQNYAQRIANHAFAHPARVGIDFVKK